MTVPLVVVCRNTRNGPRTSPANFFHRSTNVRTNSQKGGAHTNVPSQSFDEGLDNLVVEAQAGRCAEISPQLD
jgi:hypothetical protein